MAIYPTVINTNNDVQDALRPLQNMFQMMFQHNLSQRAYEKQLSNSILLEALRDPALLAAFATPAGKSALDRFNLGDVLGPEAEKAALDITAQEGIAPAFTIGRGKPVENPPAGTVPLSVPEKTPPANMMVQRPVDATDVYKGIEKRELRIKAEEEAARQRAATDAKIEEVKRLRELNKPTSELLRDFQKDVKQYCIDNGIPRDQVEIHFTSDQAGNSQVSAIFNGSILKQMQLNDRNRTAYYNKRIEMAKNIDTHIKAFTEIAKLQNINIADLARIFETNNISPEERNILLELAGGLQQGDPARAMALASTYYGQYAGLVMRAYEQALENLASTAGIDHTPLKVPRMHEIFGFTTKGDFAASLLGRSKDIIADIPRMIEVAYKDPTGLAGEHLMAGLIHPSTMRRFVMDALAQGASGKIGDRPVKLPTQLTWSSGEGKEFVDTCVDVYVDMYRRAVEMISSAPPTKEEVDVIRTQMRKRFADEVRRAYNISPNIPLVWEPRKDEVSRAEEKAQFWSGASLGMENSWLK